MNKHNITRDELCSMFDHTNLKALCRLFHVPTALQRSCRKSFRHGRHQFSSGSLMQNLLPGEATSM